MLSLTNFVESFQSATCSDGSTSIRVLWKLKEVLSHYAQTIYGSLPIWNPACGTLMWMKPQEMPCSEDSWSPDSPSPMPTAQQQRRIMLEQGHRDFDSEDEENYPPAPESDEIYGTQWYH